MERFLAVATRGLAEPLAEELHELGVEVLEKEESGVWFAGGWPAAYRVNFCSRIANRVVYPVASFRAKTQDQLYEKMREIDFSRFLKPSGRFLIDASVKNCGELIDQRFVAMKVKDAIVDKYRDQYGVRPDVDKDDPDLRIIARGYEGDFKVSIDTTGVPLFQRGYRVIGGIAPLKETLAAGLIRLSGWDCKTPFVDLMCGSGTVPIEACMMALKIAPGALRTGFSFEGFENFESDVYEKMRDEVLGQELEEPEVPIFGQDIAKKAIEASRKNAKRAGVSQYIEFSRSAVENVADELPRPCHIFVNPPYGERMDDPYQLIDTYRNIGFVLKTKMPGCKAWLLSSSKELVAELKLKSFANHSVMNGPLSCRYLGYRINSF